MASPKLFSSLLGCKCPRCRTGDVFKFPLKKIFKFSETNDYCPHCQLKFEPEPGFFWGAMYVNYGFSTALMVITGILFISNNWPINYIFVVAPLIAITLLPFGYRYSRVIMLYFITPKTHRFDEQYL